MTGSLQVVSKPVSGAGPAREQPHLVLVPKSTVTGDGPARQAGRPVRGHPLSGFETTCSHHPRFARKFISLLLTNPCLVDTIHR
jgi:hypothetical protein